MFLALGAAWLAACGQIPYQHEPRTPDVFDKIREIDLLPRFPQQAGAGGQNGGPSARAQVYPGVVVAPIEGRQQPAPNGEGGEGYELNFENTPIASVAKVVLGDILGTGFIVDPRVQGTISLASGRPVPKSDLLFVLENALRLSGVVLVRDVRGLSAHSARRRGRRRQSGFGRGARRAGLRNFRRSAAIRFGRDPDQAARQLRDQAGHGARRHHAQHAAHSGQRRRASRRHRDGARLRRRLDARAIGRRFPDSIQQSRADHHRAGEDPGFRRGRPQPEHRQVPGDRPPERHPGGQPQARPAASGGDLDQAARLRRYDANRRARLSGQVRRGAPARPRAERGFRRRRRRRRLLRYAGQSAFAGQRRCRPRRAARTARRPAAGRRHWEAQSGGTGGTGGFGNRAGGGNAGGFGRNGRGALGTATASTLGRSTRRRPRTPSTPAAPRRGGRRTSPSWKACGSRPTSPAIRC